METKIIEIRNTLFKGVAECIQSGGEMSDANWGMQEGVLITGFQAEQLVSFIDKSLKNQQTTSQQQTIERLRELCRMAYTAIRHETNPSNSMLAVYFDIEKEVILNTTEPIDQ